MGFFGCIPRFLKAHAGWVLTALGSAGLVGTTVLVAKEAPEAERQLDDAYVQKIDDINAQYRRENGIPTGTSANYVLPDEWWGKAELTFWEKTKAVLPAYIPAILTGAGTLACFWGAQIFNVKKQAALVAAYGTLAMQFDQYREAIKAEYGEEADKKAFIESQKRVHALQKEVDTLRKENGPYLYTFASLPGVIFEAKPSQVFNAFMHYNHNAMNFDVATLETLYEFAGLPEGCYDRDEASSYGWQGYENSCSWGDSYIDFDMEEVTNRDGRTVFVIETYIPPYNVNLDYQEPGVNVVDNLYEGYSSDQAKSLAIQSSWDDVYPIDKDHTCVAVHPF